MSEQVAENKPRKLIIGLTGNIATGKSAVMKLAAEKGALTIDADKVVHELMDQDPDMQAAIAVAFGSEVRRPDGRIDRRALGDIVFRDSAALSDLEKMVHPAVRAEIGRRVNQSEATIVFIEAIKLLEGGLAAACHEIWVTRCPKQRQLDRLMVCRGLDAETATRRIEGQPPQEEKVAQADVVIDTDGLMRDTEAQFALFWERLPDPSAVEPKGFPDVPATQPTPVLKLEQESKEAVPASQLATHLLNRPIPKTLGKTITKSPPSSQPKSDVITEPERPTKTPASHSSEQQGSRPSEVIEEGSGAENIEVRRARPSDIPSILLLIHKATGGNVKMKRADLLLALGERSYFIGQIGTEISAVFGWNIENLVSRIDQVFLHPLEAASITGAAVLAEIEKSADRHICEVIVVFLEHNVPDEVRNLFETCGFSRMEVEKMPRDWRTAIQESQPADTFFMIKVLRERVTHPI